VRPDAPPLKNYPQYAVRGSREETEIRATWWNEIPRGNRLPRGDQDGPIDVELCKMTWEQIEPNVLKWRVKFHKQLDVEEALEDIKQIKCNLDLLVQHEKSAAANIRIIAKHLGLIACMMGVYVVVRILEMIFQ